MFTENLDIFFDDFGSSVVRGSSSFKGILEMPDELVANGLAISTDYQLTVKTSDVSGLAYDEALQVDSINYKVKEFLSIDDGKMTKIILMKI